MCKLKYNLDLLSNAGRILRNVETWGFLGIFFFQSPVKAVRLLHKAHAGVTAVCGQSQWGCSQWLFRTHQSDSAMTVFILEPEEITP